MNAVRIADLKARLSEHLRSVRRGNPLTVLDRDTPVARIVPYSSDGSPLAIRRPAPGSRRLWEIPLPPRLKSGRDIVALLLARRPAPRPLIAYLDSSVLLRMILRQPGALKEWKTIETGVVSALAEVECLRTLDRFRLAARIRDAEIARRRETVYWMLDGMEVVEVNQTVLSRAAQPFPTSLGILDAIHLATALLWREKSGKSLVMATHDTTLATASRASGFEVLGA